MCGMFPTKQVEVKARVNAYEDHAVSLSLWHHLCNAAFLFPMVTLTYYIARLFSKCWTIRLCLRHEHAFNSNIKIDKLDHMYPSEWTETAMSSNSLLDSLFSLAKDDNDNIARKCRSWTIGTQYFLTQFPNLYLWMERKHKLSYSPLICTFYHCFLATLSLFWHIAICTISWATMIFFWCFTQRC